VTGVSVAEDAAGERFAVESTVADGSWQREPRKKIHREPAALKGLHGRIDTMIEADPAIATATIWQRLADDHGTTVAYPTLRAYVTGKRAGRKAPGKTRESQRPSKRFGGRRA